jgi:hypothetical protein
MLLVYPVAGDDMETASYQTNAEAKPLSRAGMMWFVEHVFADPSEAADPRIDLVERDDLAGLPPATVILAEIDPLTNEGVTLAGRLEEAGVPVELMTYDGVTHEFFGMGAVVPQAQEAVDMATANLREAFGENGAATADATSDGAVSDVEATAAEGVESGDAVRTDDGAAVENGTAMEDAAGADATGEADTAVDQ